MRYKSKRSNDCDISPEVKRIVYERDGHRCIYCHRNNGLPNAHFIGRGQGGLGIPENIVTLCPECHEDYDNGFKREEIGNYIREYLKWKYGQNWNEKKLIYKKHHD